LDLFRQNQAKFNLRGAKYSFLKKLAKKLTDISKELCGNCLLVNKIDSGYFHYANIFNRLGKIAQHPLVPFFKIFFYCVIFTHICVSVMPVKRQ